MKLHLGCGKRHIPGFVHIDAVDYPHVDHVATIDNLSFIADDSVDVIYNCHVLEHFKRRDVGRVLRVWHRVLKPGGNPAYLSARFRPDLRGLPALSTSRPGDRPALRPAGLPLQHPLQRVRFSHARPLSGGSGLYEHAAL